MQISYNDLWKMLIDKGISNSKFRLMTGISSGSFTKIRKNEPVSMNVLWKICEALDCDIGDIVTFHRE